MSIIGKPNRRTTNFNCVITILVWIKYICISKGSTNDVDQYKSCTNTNNVVCDALPINDLWNGLDAIFNHYNTNYCTYTCDHLIVNHDGKSNNIESKKKNK